MGKYEKLRQEILLGASDGNINFLSLRQLLLRLGFEERVKGDHHIFTKDGIIEIVNLQPRGSQAKAYQVKQIRGIILKYKLGEDDAGSI